MHYRIMAKINTRLISERKLYVFAEVVRQGSITNAANKLCMTQPAVSTIIKQLEDHFAIKLFNIVGKKIQLTPAAKVLYEQSFLVQQALDNLHQQIDRYKKGLVGDIRIIMVSSAKYFIPRAINTFLLDFPEVKFHCDIKRRENIISGIKNNDYEIGVLTDAPYNQHIARTHLGKNRLIFIAHPKNLLVKKKKITINDLAKQIFIAREQNAVISQYLFKLFDEHKMVPNILFEIDSTEAIKQAVISNLGIALVPEISVINEIKHGILKELATKNLLLENQWFLLSDNRRDSIIVNNFINYVKKIKK